MTPLRMLLGVGGPQGVFAPPTTLPFDVTAPPEGGWTEIQWPHAQADSGLTFIGYVRGEDDPNDIMVAAWDDTTEATVDTFRLHAALSDGSSTVPDTHNAPAVLVLNDGNILAAYCGHQSTTMRTRVTSSPGDIAAWDAAVNFTTSETKTYPQLAQLADDTIYLRYRGLSGGDAFLYQTKSTDNGATWDTPIKLFESGTDNLYSAMACNTARDRIDHVVINRAPTAAYGLWSFWTDDTGMHHLAGGTFADPSFPWVTSDLVQIVASGDAYPYAVSYTADDRPVLACQSKLADPVELFEYRATDADADTWNRHDITTSDPILTTALSMGGFAHDWTNANRAIVPRMIGGPRDLGGTMALYLHTSADDGVTWTTGTLVDSGPDKPGSAVAVVTPGAKLTFLWFYGDGADSDGDPFSLGLRGVA